MSFKHNGLHPSSPSSAINPNKRPWNRWVFAEKTQNTNILSEWEITSILPQINGHVCPFPLCDNELIW